MPLETDGFDSLMTDIAGMASRMDADGSGAPVAKRILEAAAQPIHQRCDDHVFKTHGRGDLRGCGRACHRLFSSNRYSRSMASRSPSRMIP